MPPRDLFRIFLSGTTADFGQTRLSLRDALSRGRCHVIHQADFPQSKADTVLKLAQLIEPCGVLIHLIGEQLGSVAAKASVDEYLRTTDADGTFLKSQPELRASLGDFSGITYTQWEVLIALHLGITVFVYGDVKHDDPNHPQRQHMDRLVKARRYTETFTDDLDLHKKVQADLLAHYLQTLPPAEVPAFSSVRHNLPTIQRFFGRDTELAKLLPDLHPDATGWGALIDGPGGMGKTTLAIRAAELAAPGHYNDIVFLSAKQTAMDPHGPHDESAFAISGFTQMLDAIARRLQKPEITQAPAEERPRLVIEALTGTRTLLVLDNLETLTDAEQRSLFAFPRRLPRNCKALLTSRPLGIPIDRQLKLRQLDQAAALQTIADIAGGNPALTAAAEPERIRLITETGGNTLLLIWTAGQVGSGYFTTIADVLAHLRSCPPGNDPLQFIFGDLLARFTLEEERIVATLSYPTEPIPINAIAEISGTDEPTTRRALKLLTNRSIVTPQDGEEKYALVPMVAEFIRHARQQVVKQMGDQLAERAFGLIESNGWGKHERFASLDAVWSSISPALPIYLSGDEPRLQKVCDALFQFFNFTGRYDESLALNEKGETIAVAANNLKDAGPRARKAGWIYFQRGNAASALDCAKRALDYWRESQSGDRDHATALQLLGHGLRLKKNFSGAHAAYNQALEIHRKINPESEDTSMAFENLAEIERLSGDFIKAERDYRESLRIAHATDYAEAVAQVTGNLTQLALDQNDWLRAEVLAQEAISLSEKVGRKDLVAADCSRLAQVLLNLNLRDDARPYAQRAVEIYSRLCSRDLPAAQKILAECDPSLVIR